MLMNSVDIYCITVPIMNSSFDSSYHFVFSFSFLYRQSVYYMNHEDPIVTPPVKLKLIGRKTVLPEFQRLTFQATGKIC